MLTRVPCVERGVNVELNTDPETAELGAIVGVVLAAVAAFLPWIQVDVGVGPADGGTGVLS